MLFFGRRFQVVEDACADSVSRIRRNRGEFCINGLEIFEECQFEDLGTGFSRIRDLCSTSSSWNYESRRL